jgi:hypothetical protein
MEVSGNALLLTWVSAGLTLAIFSFLWRDNPLYKFAEHIYVGISAGYWVVYQYHQVLKPKLWIPLVDEGRMLFLIPGFLGIFMLMRLAPKIGWLSRYALSFVVGTTAGLSIISYLQSNAMEQVKGTITPLFTGGSIVTVISSVIMVVGVIAGLVYFFFSVEHRGAFGFVSRIGIYFLMIAFGASFGYTVMARISLLIGRMQFLIDEWVVDTYWFLAGIF